LAECYEPENGRPGIEPVVLLGVLIFQFLERVPDRQAAELVKYHLGWKLALNLKLGAEGFHPTTLVNFWQRLLEAGKSDLALRAVLEALEEEGFIAKRSKQRLDSTHILGAVARLSALECVRETLALALEELAEHLPEANGRNFGNSSGNVMSRASLITKVPKRRCNLNAARPAPMVCAC
jgi:transposase